MLRMASVVVIALGACGDGGEPDPGREPDANEDRGPAPYSCEETVATALECSSYESVCTGVCGAAWECCFPTRDDDGNATWGVLYNDCAQCDAGPDDAN